MILPRTCRDLYTMAGVGRPIPDALGINTLRTTLTLALAITVVMARHKTNHAWTLEGRRQSKWCAPPRAEKYIRFQVCLVPSLIPGATPPKDVPLCSKTIRDHRDWRSVQEIITQITLWSFRFVQDFGDTPSWIASFMWQNDGPKMEQDESLPGWSGMLNWHWSHPPESPHHLHESWSIYG